MLYEDMQVWNPVDHTEKERDIIFFLRFNLEPGPELDTGFTGLPSERTLGKQQIVNREDW